MGKLTISLAIFNGCNKLPECMMIYTPSDLPLTFFCMRTGLLIISLEDCSVPCDLNRQCVRFYSTLPFGVMKCGWLGNPRSKCRFCLLGDSEFTIAMFEWQRVLLAFFRHHQTYFDRRVQPEICL